MEHKISLLVIALISILSIPSCNSVEKNKTQNLDIPEYTKPGACYFSSFGNTIGYRGIRLI